MKPIKFTLVATFFCATMSAPLSAELLYHYTFDLNGGANDGLQDSGNSGIPNPLILGPSASIVGGCARIGDGALRLDTSLQTDATPEGVGSIDTGYDGAYSSLDIEPGAWATGDLLTITAWIRAEASGHDASASIVTLGTNPGNGNRSTFRLNGGTRHLRHEVEGGNTIASGGPVLNDTLWHHVAMTIDPRPRTGTEETDDAIQFDVVMYIDGVRYTVEGAPPLNLTGTNTIDNLTALEFGLGRIRIGDGINSGDRDFNGIIDDVRIYDEALDESAIQALASESGAILTCFVADRPNLFLGEIVTFSWDAFDVDSLTLSNDQNGNTVDLLPLTDSVTGRGTLSFKPVSATYTINASRNSGAETAMASLGIDVQSAPDVAAAVIPSITDGSVPVQVCWQATSISSTLNGSLTALSGVTATDSETDFGALLAGTPNLTVTLNEAILTPDPIGITSIAGNTLTLETPPLGLLRHSENNVNREYEASNLQAQIDSGLGNDRWADANNPANTGNNGAAYFRDSGGVLTGRDPVDVNDPAVPGITKAYESGPEIGFATVWEGGQLDAESASDFTMEVWFQPNTLGGGDQILVEWGGNGRGSYLAFVDNEVVLQMDADPQGKYTLPDTGLGETPITVDYDIDPTVLTSGTIDVELGAILTDPGADFDSVLTDPDAIYLIEITSGAATGAVAEIKSGVDTLLELRGPGLAAGSGSTYDIRKATLPWTQIVMRWSISANDTADDSAEIFVNGELVISLEDVNLQDIAGSNGGGIGGQFGTIGQGGPVTDNQSQSIFDGKVSIVRVHTIAVPDTWILASYLEVTGGTPDAGQEAQIEASLQNIGYTVNWLIQPDSITINDGSTDVFTTSDPMMVESGCFDAGVIATDTTYTVTAAFAAGDNNSMVTSLVTTSDGTSYEEIILADNPLAFYRFEEESGSIAVFDYSGNNYHSVDNVGTPGGGLGSPGVIGRSWIADGMSGWRVPVVLNPIDPDGDDVIDDNGTPEDPSDDIPDVDPDNMEGFSLEAMVRAEDVRRINNQPLFQQEDLNGTGRSALSVDINGSLRTFYGGLQSSSAGMLLDSSWCHVAITVTGNGLDYTTRFYIDGQPADVDDIFLAVGGSDGAWRLGVNKGDTEFWVGELDEMAFYDYPLDDPNFDGDTGDSLLPSHAQAVINKTELNILGFGTTTEVVSEGSSVDLRIKVGAGATTVEIDNGVGTVIPVNGYATVTVTPPVGTTTYTLTVNGTDTFAIDVTALLPIRITDSGVTPGNLFSVTAENLIEGQEYDLFFSLDLTSPFVALGVSATADATGVLTFEDPVPIDTLVTPEIYYRVGEVTP